MENFIWVEFVKIFYTGEYVKTFYYDSNECLLLFYVGKLGLFSFV